MLGTYISHFQRFDLYVGLRLYKTLRIRLGRIDLGRVTPLTLCINRYIIHMLNVLYSLCT